MKKLLLLIALLAMGVSCKKSNPEPVPAPFARYTLGGVTTTLNYSSSFSKDFCSSSTYCCRFYASEDTSKMETLKIGIPGDPLVGYVYYSGMNRFSCYYINPSGVHYNMTESDTSLFTVVFTQWDGQGGWGKGHFSGWLKSVANDSILFQNGYFENKIWTIFP